MPMANVIDDFNEAMQRIRLDRELRATVLEALATEGGLATVLIEHLGFPVEDVAVLAEMPPTLAEGLRAACRQALTDGQRIQVIFAPAYDHAIQIHDHPTGISIALSMPYPNGLSRTEFAASIRRPETATPD